MEEIGKSKILFEYFQILSSEIYRISRQVNQKRKYINNSINQHRVIFTELKTTTLAYTFSLSDNFHQE